MVHSWPHFRLVRQSAGLGLIAAEFDSIVQQLQAEIAQSRMFIRAATKGPMILALRLLDRQVINGRKPKSHQTIAIKLPVLIAIGAEPVSGVITPFVGEPHGNAV